MAIAIWRVIKDRWVAEGLSGEGARLYGGRWTSPGQPVIYCAQHLSLAILEILVHLGHRSALASYSKIGIEVADDLVQQVSISELPDNWDVPFPGIDLQRIGDRWLQARQSLVLRIPSAVTQEEFNYLINPLHQDYALLNLTRSEPMPVDTRLFSRE